MNITAYERIITWTDFGYDVVEFVHDVCDLDICLISRLLTVFLTVLAINE